MKNPFKILMIIIGSLFSFFVYKKGRDSEKLKNKEKDNKNLKKIIKSANEAKKIKNYINNGNVDDMRQQLFNESIK